LLIVDVFRRDPEELEGLTELSLRGLFHEKNYSSIRTVTVS
jgi:hypothetical protein